MNYNVKPGSSSLGAGGSLLLLCLLFSVVFPVVAMSETVIIPPQTRMIESRAFDGCASIDSVSLPEGLLEIGSYAFAACDLLREVTIPRSVEIIGEGAFPLTCRLICFQGSPAAAWAEASGYEFTLIEPAPAFYALLIGQTYEQSSVTPVLHGPHTDITAMRAMLSSMTGTPYRITSASNLSADSILGVISQAFAPAQEQDICLLYYSGHGHASTVSSRRGALVGTDGQLVTMPALRSLLDEIPGNKILLLDSCYSGSILDTASAVPSSASLSAARPEVQDGQADQAAIDLDAINDSIISVFSSRKRTAAASGRNYYIITSATAAETSSELYDPASKQYYGAFTYGLTYGSGYNELAGTLLSSMRADSDLDEAISLKEAYVFAHAMASSIASGQHAQVYPADSVFPLWSR